MTGLLEESHELDEARLRYGLTGNLCRCTGYTPIMEAGAQVDAASHPLVETRYPSGAMLAEFRQRREQLIELQAEWDAQQSYCGSPASLDEALALLAKHSDAMIVAGATDVGVRINKSNSIPPVILDLNRVTELDGVVASDRELVVGARTSWTTLEAACEELVPEFHKIIELFGAPQIRHVGTIGGNIANASPIADSLPFLYVMEAVLELRSVVGSRDVNINDFYKGYKLLDLRPGELIARVRVPLPASDELLRLYKVSRRRDLDIASFTAAIRVRLDGEKISDVAIAFGAVGPTVIRARQTEQFLRGRALDETTMRRAGDIAVDEISPISDVRGAADYRYQLARNILLKFYYESQILAVPA
jgi:xanthine dehydrogenase small subunit